MSADSWLSTTLGKVAEFGNGGAWNQDEYTADGVRVVRVSDVKGDTLDLSECKYLSMAALDRYRRHQLRTGDLIICTVGSHPTQPASVVGRAVVVPKFADGALLNQNAVRVRPAVPHVHAGWLGFLGRSRRFHEYIIGCAGGAASQVRMPIGLLKEMPISVPPFSIQRRISSILSAYDNLIENNTRRIAILEEMARRIYEEWFVRFRFPGHDGVRMVESELGVMPEGWRTDVLAGVCEPKTGIQTGPFGSQLHKADYSEVGVPVLMPKDLIGFRIVEDSVARVPEATAESLKRHRMRPGDIAYGRRGDIGRRAFIMAHQTGWLCGTGCLRIRPDKKSINSWYVFNYLGQESVVGLIAGRAHGVTMPNLNAQLLESVPVVCPPRELQDQFEQISFPMAELRESLIAKNANLRTTRDLLLHKLISGELGVSAMPEPEALAA